MLRTWFVFLCLLSSNAYCYFSIWGDFIYWTAREDGLSAVMSGVGNNAEHGSVKNLNWQLDPGFKVGLGKSLKKENWRIGIQYTYYYTNPSTSRSGSNLFPLFDIAGLSTPNDSIINDAKADLDLHFHVVDLDLLQKAWRTPFFTLKPFVGLKGSYIPQKYALVYSVRLASSGTFEKLKMILNQDSWGIGPRVGIQTEWGLFKSFRLIGDVALSGLWNRFCIERRDREIQEPLPACFLIRTDNNFFTTKPVLELAFGMQWKIAFFSLRALWEKQIWFHQNQLIHFFEESGHGDLILQGLTLEALFTF